MSIVTRERITVEYNSNDILFHNSNKRLLLSDIESSKALFNSQFF